MIASLRGTVVGLRLDSAVLEVGGVGYLAFATPATLSGLRVGEPGYLATSLVVREDSLTIYGFGDDDERTVFEIVQTVSGVGPRLALAMLAVHTPDRLRRAVAAEDLAALQRVPGIGKKGAQRIVLELADKLGPVSGEMVPAASTPSTSRQEAVVEALVGLGWSAKVAADAVESVSPGGIAAPEIPASEIPAVLRAALQHLGGHRG